MCGFTGAYFINSSLGAPIDARIRASLEAIGHRGPDASGYWQSTQANLAFGHKRLSIVDLSSAGAQPMTDHSGKWVITYNGEVYNHLDIRQEMLASGWIGEFRGHSDTETLLEAIQFWGVSVTLSKCRGMFAMAIWNKETKTLHLCRDRAGEKPLYFGASEGGVAFGSELKAIRQVLPSLGALNPDALHTFLRRGYVCGENAILDKVIRIRPSCVVSLSIALLNELCQSPSNARLHEIISKASTPYWNFAEITRSRTDKPFKGSAAQASETLGNLLSKAVQEQLAADVPIGAFLSGGIDSTAIVATAQRLTSRPVKTFSIGFEDQDYDESKFAKRVAAHIGTDHHELIVGEREAIDTLTRIPKIYCEPFADSSQIPTILVSQLAKKYVTVSLSGDAGDELFGGYQRYFAVPPVWEKMQAMPLPIRKTLSKTITSIPPQAFDFAYRGIAPLLSSQRRQVQVGDRLHKLAGLISASNSDDLYDRLLSKWPPQIMKHASPSVSKSSLNNAALVDCMMKYDFEGYLQDDILVKVDRASMASSLESRVPFLDQRIIEFAWSLPQNLLIENGVGKVVLRNYLYSMVPKPLLERPKMGFALPIGHWLKGQLREWAEDLLDPKKLSDTGYLNTALIRATWEDHLSGKTNHQHALWNILMFQAWKSEWQQ
jgi:asparagine synthase (glutamine-hydrolysing)